MKPPMTSAPAGRSINSPAGAAWPKPATRPIPGNREWRTCTCIEATTEDLDIRFVVTSLTEGTAEHIYEMLYWPVNRPRTLSSCTRASLPPISTSCRSPLASQMR